jgi:GntR family transcriptional repressor for pyruvate dehydrogenase complex
MPEKIARANLGDLIAEKIRENIINGKLKPGEKLPPHEVLCQDWGVSRVSLRDALKKLANIGLIEIHHGRGTFVSTGNKVPFERQLQFLTPLDQETIFELMESRKVIETSLARFAAERYRDDEIKELKFHLEEMRMTIQDDDSLKFAISDFHFHKTIGKLAKNKILLMMLENVQDLIREQQREMFAYELERGNRRIDKSFEEHEEIYQMIEENKPDEAADKMLKHIQRNENIIAGYFNNSRDERDHEEYRPRDPS